MPNSSTPHNFQFLMSAFRAAPPDLRAAVVKDWFRHLGSTWFEDFPHLAERTLCESCSTDLTGKEIFRNGNEPRCEWCMDRNLRWWEEDGADRDYFGFGAVDRAIEFGADEFAAWYETNKLKTVLRT